MTRRNTTFQIMTRRNTTFQIPLADPDAAIIEQALYDKLQNDRKLNCMSSRTGKRYLGLALIYLEQNNLLAALEAYDKGIKAISILFDEFDDDIKNSNSNDLQHQRKSQQAAKDYNNTRTQQKTNATMTSSQPRKILYFAYDDGSNNRDQKQYQLFQQDLSILQKERHTVLVTLFKHNQRFHQSLPTEILSKIFSYLRVLEDLLQCASVRKQWCNIILTFPIFWSKFTYAPKINSAHNKHHLPAIKVTDRYKKNYTIYIKGLSYPNGREKRDILAAFLAIANNDIIEALCFKNFKMTNSDTDLLGNVLEKMNGPTLKQVEFIDCVIPDDKIVNPILKSCSNLTRLVYDEAVRPLKEPPTEGIMHSHIHTPISMPFLSLTYLKLFAGLSCYRNYYNQNVVFANWIHRDMFSQCPNLAHLFLDGLDGIKVNFGACATLAFKNCLRLRNVVIGNNGNMPETVISDIDNDEYNDDDMDDNHSSSTATTSTEKGSASPDDKLLTATTTSKGVCRFVILNTHIHENEHREPDSNFQRKNRLYWEQCFSVFNESSRDSLKLLYMLCNIATMHCLHQWCDYGIASNLRELHLSDRPIYTLVKKKHIASSIDNSGLLGKLFPCVPALQVLVITQTFIPSCTRPFAGKCKSYTKGQLFVDNHALRQLAKYCRRISYIKITGFPVYTSDAVLSLSEETTDPHSTSSSIKLPITYLEMDIPRCILLQLVKQMISLKDINVRLDRDSVSEPEDLISLSEHIEVQSILRERGGSLIMALYKLKKVPLGITD